MRSLEVSNFWRHFAAASARSGPAASVAGARLCIGLVAGLFALLAAGCGHDGRLIVVVDSDIPTLTDVSVSTTRLAGGGVDTRDFHLDAATRVPFSFAVEPNGHPQDGVEIVVEGFDCAPPCSAIVRRRVQTGFVSGSTRVVRMFLSASCAGAGAPTCSATQSCDRGTCVEVYVPPDRLPTVLHPGDELDGGNRDGGPDDAGTTDAGTTDAATDGGPPVDAWATDTGVPTDAWSEDAWTNRSDGGHVARPVLIATLSEPPPVVALAVLGQSTLYGTAMAMDTTGSALVVGAPGVSHVDLWREGVPWAVSFSAGEGSIGDQLGIGVAIAQPSAVPGMSCVLVAGAPTTARGGGLLVNDCTSATGLVELSAGSELGASVALSMDGLHRVEGAPGLGQVRFPSGLPSSIPSTATPGVGVAVAIARDGSGVFSNPGAMFAGMAEHGVLYAFDAAHTVTAITSPGPEYRMLGSRLVESDDGAWMAATAKRDGDSDAVLLYRHGASWTLDQVFPVTTTTTAVQAGFRPLSSVPIAIDASGSSLLLGDPAADAARLYVRDGASWAPHAIGSQGSGFGGGVALSRDGRRFAIAAPQPYLTGPVTGHVYVYELQ